MWSTTLVSTVTQLSLRPCLVQIWSRHHPGLEGTRALSPTVWLGFGPWRLTLARALHSAYVRIKSHEINFGAVCGANLVTLSSKFERIATFVAHCVVRVRALETPARSVSLSLELTCSLYLSRTHSLFLTHSLSLKRRTCGSRV